MSWVRPLDRKFQGKNPPDFSIIPFPGPNDIPAYIDIYSRETINMNRMSESVQKLGMHLRPLTSLPLIHLKYDSSISLHFPLS